MQAINVDNSSEGVSVEACDPGARKKIIKRVTDLATEPNLATKSKLEDKREKYL